MWFLTFALHRVCTGMPTLRVLEQALEHRLPFDALGMMADSVSVIYLRLRASVTYRW